LKIEEQKYYNGLLIMRFV